MQTKFNIGDKVYFEDWRIIPCPGTEYCDHCGEPDFYNEVKYWGGGKIIEIIIKGKNSTDIHYKIKRSNNDIKELQESFLFKTKGKTDE